MTALGYEMRNEELNMNEELGMRNKELRGASFVKKSLSIKALHGNANRHSSLITHHSSLFSQGEK